MSGADPLWTEADRRSLRCMWSLGVPAGIIGRELGRSAGSTRIQASLEGARRPDWYLSLVRRRARRGLGVLDEAVALRV